VKETEIYYAQKSLITEIWVENAIKLLPEFSLYLIQLKMQKLTGLIEHLLFVLLIRYGAITDYDSFIFC
jgi:hypothetical protein